MHRHGGQDQLGSAHLTNTKFSSGLFGWFQWSICNWNDLHAVYLLQVWYVKLFSVSASSCNSAITSDRLRTKSTPESTPESLKLWVEETYNPDAEFATLAVSQANAPLRSWGSRQFAAICMFCCLQADDLTLVGSRESMPERVNASAATRLGRLDVCSTRELHDAEQQDSMRGKLADEVIHLLTSPDQERMSACAATVDLTALLKCFCKFGQRDTQSRHVKQAVIASTAITMPFNNAGLSGPGLFPCTWHGNLTSCIKQKH